MKRLMCPALLFALVPAVVAAQAARSPDVAASASSWTLDLSGTRINVVSLEIGWRLSQHHSLQVKVGGAGQADLDPGVVSAQGGVRLESPRDRERIGIFGTLSGGVFFWNAENNEQARESCTPAALCLWEGAAYDTGREYALALQVGMRFPLHDRVALEPALEASRAVGARTGGRAYEATKSLRLGVALAWRP